MTKKEKVWKYYNDKSLWKPPSMSTIARKAGCTKSYVHKILHTPLPTKKQ